MTVAVVIVNYNSSLLLERCLQCLSDQTERADRVIIVDNASTEPESLALLEEISNAEVIYCEENLGYGAAINRAVSSLQDIDYVCCLNPDAFPKPEWLANLILEADQHPSYGSFASLMLKAEDESTIDGAGDELHFTGIPWRRFHGKLLADTEIETGPVFSACAGAAMYRIEAFTRFGGFDESFFMYVEDIDLGFRLQLAGLPCLLVRGAIVLHVGSAITGEASPFSIYHGHRNLVYNYFKNMPMVLLLWTLPFHLLANFWSILVFACRGSTTTICKAKLDATLQISSAVRARDPAKQLVSNGYIWQLLAKTPVR
jgi:GT2 family glycosyltransferase